jgi:Prokaryotic RING finger family 1
MAHLEIEAPGSGSTLLALPGDENPPRLQYLVHGAGGTPVVLTSDCPEHAERAAACLLLVADRWVVLAGAGDAALAVNHVEVVGFKVLDHGDTLELSGLRLRLSEERIEVLAAGARLIEQRRTCPVCQRELAAGDRVIYCPRCNLAHHTEGAAHHDDCWSFNGRCASSPFCGFHVRRGTGARAAVRGIA